MTTAAAGGTQGRASSAAAASKLDLRALSDMNHEQPVTVHQATLAEIEDIVPLFDAYRQFYGNPGNPEDCRAFLRERFKYNQSIIFLANDGKGAAVGFAQLYPSFSSGFPAPDFHFKPFFCRFSTPWPRSRSPVTPSGGGLRARRGRNTAYTTHRR